ncbi:MAG: cation-transporting P-type ATPase [Eubacteriales bacterium]|nr:cation-transporting P-type ATPase [Eubacteriales bacterium]
MTEKWYDYTPEQTESKLKSSLYSGLTRKNAASRLRQHGSNIIYPVSHGPFYVYLKHILTDFTSILLVITALLAMLFEQNISAAVLIGILSVNIISTILTYIKAHRVLEGMMRHALPTAKVMREGKLYMVKQELVVPGDIIFISAGDIVPADARLIESSALTALEVNLTGVTQSAKKDAGFIEHRDIPISERRNMIYAATIITHGSGKAIVCDTGDNTLVCAMGKSKPLVTHEQLPVFKVLKRYCSVWSMFMIVMILALTVLNLVFSLNLLGLFEIFLTGLTLAVASMSEFYTAFGYIIVACGIFGAFQRNKEVNSGALIKNTAKLTTLKEMSCLIVPREALFSVREAKIERIVANGITMNANMRGFAENSANTLRYAVISTGLYGGNRLVANNMRNENVYSPEEDTIIAAAQKYGLYNIDLENRYPIIEHLPASGHNRFETTLVEYGGNNVAVVRGDAQQILGVCRYYSEKGRVLPMTAEKLNDFRITASLITKEAFRVIAVASKNTSYNNLTRIVSCQTDMTLEGLLCIREKMLPGAAMKIAHCRAANMKIIMTCDDVNDNNRYIAGALGIISGDDEIINSQRLYTIKDGLFRANIHMYRLYEGLSVNQKQTLIRYLKDSGEIVGFLARELDEISLLDEADAGFSQSITISSKAKKTRVDITDRSIPVYLKNSKAASKTGCDAINFVSDVIVSEPDKIGSGGFNAMVNSVEYSKVIYQNLLRGVRYLLASQSMRFFIVLYSIFTGTVLLNTVQLLFCGLIVDFAAVIIIAFERPAHDIIPTPIDTEEKLRHPFRHNAESILFGLIASALTAFIPAILKYFHIEIKPDMLSSAAFCGVILSQFVLLSEIKKDRSVFVSVSFNRVYGFVLILTAVFIAGGQLTSAGNLFAMVRHTLPYAVVSILCPAAIFIIYELYKLIKHAAASKNKKRRTKPQTEKTVFSLRLSGFCIEDTDDDEATAADDLESSDSEIYTPR